ncbi:MAG: hypothetical protein K8R37_12385 [Bacteroidales bacterium]|nr:hypothetical protein [Bacteroidales bacterium]
MIRLPIFWILLFCSIGLHAQSWIKSINKRDNKGIRQGLWITYWDEEEKVPMSKVWFKDDNGEMAEELFVK